MRDLADLFQRTIDHLSGRTLVARALADSGLEANDVQVVALGKAAGAMVQGAADALGLGLVGVAACNVDWDLPAGVQLHVGSHPLPDHRSEAAGRVLLDAVAHRGDRRLLYLVSGGGSAIAAVPRPPLTIDDKLEVGRRLLRSGAPIEEVNVVRRHLSALKGGQLAPPSPVPGSLALVLCDIPSGELSAVASGPSCPDASTFADCLEIVARHGVSLPEAARALLESGARGEIPETPKPDDPRFGGLTHRLLATPADLARTAATLATSDGVQVEVLENGLSAEVERVSSELGSRVRERLRGLGPGRRLLLIAAGEPTVRISGAAGRGGRMQHLALLLAASLENVRFRALCGASDGHDGDSKNAGARVDGLTARLAQERGIFLPAALLAHDSATACEKLGAALPGFRSSTNLCDLVLIELEGA